MDSGVNDLITEHYKSVSLGDATERLIRSVDFKLVIEEHLFKNEATSLIAKLSKLNKTDNEYLETVRKLDAISFTQNYLQDLIQEGIQASQSIREAQYQLSNDED